MTVFAIIAQPNENSARLEPAILGAYPNHMKVAAGVWLVASTEGVQTVSEKLGVTNGGNGAAIIFAVSSYYGRANPNIWDWIKNNWGGDPIG